jgi:hypothetical protein
MSLRCGIKDNFVEGSMSKWLEHLPDIGGI